LSRILIIGESCTDEFIYCSAQRLAPDLPIPILHVEESSTNPGMAMNVVRNIKKYHQNCEISTNTNWQDIRKTRYVDIKSNHTFIRIDTKEHIKPFQNNIDFTKYDLIAISDYNKGFLSTNDIFEITSQHKNVFLDTKKVLGSWAENAFIIKINDYEYQRSLPYLTEELKNKTKIKDSSSYSLELIRFKQDATTVDLI
jgi:D-beta-D-heptose 7-phosphate kinase/D-beta-D-heptose 1-phosphate adenosyltransferase